MIVSLENIKLSYDEKTVILKNITAKVEDTSRIGLIGVNGAGKTTLLNIISGELEADDGVITRAGNCEIGFLRQSAGLESGGSILSEMQSVFEPLRLMEREMRELEHEIAALPAGHERYGELSKRYAALQESFEAREGYKTGVKIATVLNGMGFGEVDPATPVDVLSGGERTRLALCKLLLETPSLLILDEPTNHLDFKTLLWLEDYLTGYKGALLIVSHDRYFLDRLCNSIWEVQNHELSAYPGNYSTYVRLKAERDERRRKEYEAQQHEITELKDFIARNIVRATTANRAKSRRKTLERMELVDRPKPPPKPPVIRFEKKRDPVRDVLVIEDVSLSVGEGEQRKKLLEHLSLAVMRGEKLAMIGTNGVGKTSLLRTVMGELPCDSGVIEWGRNVDVSYFDQGDDVFDEQKTALDALWDCYPREYEHTVRTALGRVGLTGENVFKPVGLLSGGERARLKFARLMLAYGNVLILDEPTNHLDLASKEVIDRALTEFDGTLIVVSHDRYLLNKFPDKIIELHPGGAVVYQGRYEQYMQQKENAAVLPVKKPEKEPKQPTGYRSKKQRSEEAAWKRRIAELEEQIERLEAEIWRLEEELGQPEIASDYVLVREKCDILEQKKLELDCAMTEWSELESG